MRTAAEMIQPHGAIGITWEHQAHRYVAPVPDTGEDSGLWEPFVHHRPQNAPISTYTPR
jgi:hypothetical protein